jgi:glycosyltransferase involved in cell wall biosynthesis
MKITFLLPVFAPRPSGGFRVVYEYANRLVARGHEVTVVHPRRLPYEHPWPYLGVWPWLRAHAGRVRRALFTPKLTWFPIDPRVKMLFTRDITEHRVPDADLIFATWWVTAEVVQGYGPAKGRKCYMIQHYEVWGGPEERVNATWRAPLAKTVSSRWLYQQGIELGVAPESMTRIPYGLDCGLFRMIRPIEERPRRVVMMSSTSPFKGLGDGIRALELARERVPALQAVFFGIDPRPESVPEWIEYVQDPPARVLVEEIYNGSSISLCASHAEGWHLPSFEALACGCAIVSTDNGGVSEYTVPGETSLLSPPGEPEALAANLIRLLEDDEERVRMARLGQERMREFDWERSTDLLEAFVREQVGVTAGG